MAKSTWPDGELSAAGKLDTWPARREARYRCGQGDRARTMRSGRCGLGDSAKAMRPGGCGQGDAAWAMRLGRCGPGDLPGRAPRWNGFTRQRRQPDSKNNKSRCKIGPKSIEVGRLGYDGASLERHWHPRAPRGRPRSVSRASWGVPGTPQQSPESPRGRPGAPKGAPGSIRECAEVTKIEAELHLGW